MLRNSPPGNADIGALKRKAAQLRRHMLTMARGQGQGYIGQGLGIADTLAALYFHELRYDPHNLAWPDRDRFLLSTGHYSIALWAALAEAGIIPVEELITYGADNSRLEMSTLDTTPGVEMIGGFAENLREFFFMAVDLFVDLCLKVRQFFLKALCYFF